MPVRSTNQISLAFQQGSREALEQTAKRSQRNMSQLMHREGLFAFINNHGKANPSLEDITAAYAVMKCG